MEATLARRPAARQAPPPQNRSRRRRIKGPMTEIVGGERATEAVGRALERVTALVPYLAARINPDLPPATDAVGSDRRLPGDRQWMAARSLIDDPGWLGAV